MIKAMTVAICDSCGAAAPAKMIDFCRNEGLYGIPDGWTKGKNDNVHFCPSCSKKLSKNTEVTYRG